MTNNLDIHPVRKISDRKVGNCGPHAVAALTGRPLELITAIINRFNGYSPRRLVSGTSTTALRVALDACGYNLDRAERRKDLLRERYGEKPTETRPTFREWYDESEELREHPMLVTVRYHWVAVHRGYVVDTFHPDGKHILSSRHLRARVRTTYTVHPYDPIRIDLTDGELAKRLGFRLSDLR